jgi:hypothetical protein
VRAASRPAPVRSTAPSSHPPGDAPATGHPGGGRRVPVAVDVHHPSPLHSGAAVCSRLVTASWGAAHTSVVRVLPRGRRRPSRSLHPPLAPPPLGGGRRVSVGRRRSPGPSVLGVTVLRDANTAPPGPPIQARGGPPRSASPPHPARRSPDLTDLRDPDPLGAAGSAFRRSRRHHPSHLPRRSRAPRAASGGATTSAPPGASRPLRAGHAPPPQPPSVREVPVDRQRRRSAT